MAEPVPKFLRCAVYTRKSSDEGLEQEFNSLHAQREACEAYITSQRHEGWRLAPKAYDDGGFSGGSMERPALKALLTDIAAGLIDTVVVYKIDRLTRSLHDFSRIVEVLDKRGASFVSVTQAFNTTTSMGRLTLNVLLSFAQFEREVTGERIRDKIAASKAKGMWMGGYRPLGYRVEGRELKPHATEAPVIAELFELFLTLNGVDALIAEAGRLGLFGHLERRTDKPMSRGALYHLLRNPLYVGEIRHKTLVHPGRHQAIVSRELFDAVQKAVGERRRVRVEGSRAKTSALLTGLLFDGAGRRYTPTHTLCRGRLYAYYCITEDAEAAPMPRLPARAFEAHLQAELLKALVSPATMAPALMEANVTALTIALDRLRSWAEDLERGGALTTRSALRSVIEKVVVRPEGLELRLQLAAILQGQAPEHVTLGLPLFLGRRGGALRVTVTPEGGARRAPDERLVTLLAKGALWFDQLKTGAAKSREELAEREGVSAAYVGHLIEFAFLAPDLKREILLGAQPPQLTTTLLKQLCPLPLDWRLQRRSLRQACGLPPA